MPPEIINGDDLLRRYKPQFLYGSQEALFADSAATLIPSVPGVRAPLFIPLDAIPRPPGSPGRRRG